MNNTYGLNQRVRAAVMLQPSLLSSIYSKQGTNQQIFNSAVNRLLPYRTSVEIEHLGQYSKIKDFKTSIGCTTIQSSRYYDINSVFRKKHKGSKIEINYDCGGDEINRCEETKISIYNWKDLWPLQDYLNTIKPFTKVDLSGSIHIHVDITDWVLRFKKDTKKQLGLLVFAHSVHPKVIAYTNEILNMAAEISNLKINPKEFNFSRGYPEGRGHISNNYRYLCFESFSFLYRRQYDSLLQEAVRTNNRALSNALSNYCIDEQLINSHLVDNKIKAGVGMNNGKRNWINMRDMPSFEIRTFECSLDYTEIVLHMINCNRLVKRILQIIDYLGNEAMKDPKILCFE